jgi:hypothetical protein
LLRDRCLLGLPEIDTAPRARLRVPFRKEAQILLVRLASGPSNTTLRAYMITGGNISDVGRATEELRILASAVRTMLFE